MSAVGGSPLGKMGSTWKWLFAALVASPLAVLFGAPAHPAPRGEVERHETLSKSAPKDECVQRFLGPIRQLSGRTPGPSATAAPAAAHGGAGANDSTAAAHGGAGANDGTATVHGAAP